MAREDRATGRRWTLTTHLRARAAQAGVLLAVVAGLVAVAPAMALADAPEVQITDLGDQVNSGGQLQIRYRVKPDLPDGTTQAVGKIDISGMSCSSGRCGGTTQFNAGDNDFQATLTAPNVDPGQTKSVQVRITVTIVGEQPVTTDPSTVNVKGADKPQTVTSISGKVKDQAGKSISGASVAMKDDAGNAYQATTNGSGSYAFNSTQSKPIVPGNISIGALKDGFDGATVQIQAAAGKSVSVATLTLKAVAASPSPTPSTTLSPAASAPAADAPTDEPTDENSAGAGLDANKTASDQGGGGGSTLFIVIGGLLVAAGIGAIVLVLMRRRNNNSPDGDDDDPSVMGGGPGGMVPPSQGRFNDATRVAGPMGAGRDATMVAPRGPAGNAMADAPTMLQRPVEDEFPDPYGVPIPQQGGYAGGGNWDNQVPGDGYGNPGGQPYAEPTQYGRPDDGYGAGTYGAAAVPAAGAAPYGASAQPDQRRYDEPTGMYRPEAGQDDGYDEYGQPYGGAPQYGGAAGGQQYAGPDEPAGYAGGGGYQGGAGGYDDQGGYDPRGGNGYGGPPPTGSYGAPAAGSASVGGAAAAPGGTYGGQQYGGGYEERGGYDGQPGGGYDQRGGYGGGPGGAVPGGAVPGGAAPGGAPAGGYDPDGNYGSGYDERGGYGDQGGYEKRGYNGRGPARPQEPSQPGQRRSGEWEN